jgi:hypothetical protein
MICSFASMMPASRSGPALSLRRTHSNRQIRTQEIDPGLGGHGGWLCLYYRDMTISEEKYVASTTYRKSGTAVPTPTWIVALDGARVGFWTSSASGKYKRLRDNPRIVLQPSDARGRVTKKFKSSPTLMV